ncbi:MAG: hypothetical protein AB7I33_14075 [Gemmatimonadales bacterium]
MPSKPQLTTPLGNFNYGSLQSLMVFYSVPASVVRPLLKGTGLEPGIFDGKALVNLNFERYAGFGSTYSSFVDEVEFNVVVFPRTRAGDEPKLSVAQYLTGDDQSKTYGNYRINVPCDSPVAVTAGSKKYGEVKFVASFDFSVPDVNDPAVQTWWIRCYASPRAPKSQLPYIFDLQVNTNASGIPAPSIAAFSPVPAYANLKVKGRKHMITSARVVFGVFRSWFNASGKTPIPPLPAGAVQLTIGEARHRMQREMAAVFKGNPPAVGILLYESQPAAASGHTLVNTPIR